MTASTSSSSATTSAAAVVSADSALTGPRLALSWNEKSVQSMAPLSTRELHMIFTEYHEKKMHKGVPLQIKDGTDADKTRVRLVVDVLRGVATTDERHKLCNGFEDSGTAAGGLTLATLSVSLQARFMKRITSMEKENQAPYNGKPTASGIESRISKLNKAAAGSREKLKSAAPPAELATLMS